MEKPASVVSKVRAISLDKDMICALEGASDVSKPSIFISCMNINIGIC